MEMALLCGCWAGGGCCGVAMLDTVLVPIPVFLLFSILSLDVLEVMNASRVALGEADPALEEGSGAGTAGLRASRGAFRV